MASGGYLAVKRGADVVAAVVGLAVGAPVMAAAAWAVRRSMGSPVLFRQQRAGRDGVPFELIKLRTMRTLRPGEDPLGSDADRLTPVGSRLRDWSIDELPQLLNVLRGQMSLVGPRPLPVLYVARYSAQQRRRLEATPGITGLAQVEGRNTVEWDRRFELDVWYVDHRSLTLDTRILLRTVLRVLTRHGIAAEGAATMQEFMPPARPPR